MIFSVDCEKFLQFDSLVKENSTGCALDERGMFYLYGNDIKFKCNLKFSQLYTN
jgi:hypothetical protein